MDFERNDTPQPEDWLDDILGEAPPEVELGPDEHAVQSAGLIHPDDMELEMILAEHRQDDPLSDPDAMVIDQSVFTDDEDMTVVDNPPEEDIRLYEAMQSEDEAQEQAPDEVQEAVSMEVTQFFAPQGQEEQPQEAVEIPEEVPAEDPAAEEAEEETGEEMPARKGRPRMKKGYGLLGIPHLISTVIWLAIIVAIGVSLGRTLWLCCSDLMAFGKEPKQAVITITDDDTIDTISQKLGEKGLVRYPGLFKTFAELTGKAENISTGTFTLNARLDYNAMINGMTYYGASREEVEVMFPEGYTCAQIFKLLEENNVCTVAELEEYAANGELGEYWFLEGVERGHKYCLEGYLFPDTYQFYTNDEPGRVLEKFLDAFDARFTDIMKERLVAINEEFAQRLANEGFDQAYIDAHPITIREAVIIASLIEKESAGGEESYDISSVIYNRLTDSSQPPYLNIDAALIYALDGNIDPETGKSKPLTYDDLELDNPYNTYLYAGLTPGPISNPGQESLNAAVSPNDTNYYYYALDPSTGEHHFSKTYEEHLKFLDSLED